MDTTATATRPRFPQWTARERDLWVDLLDSYSGTLLMSAAEDRLTDDAAAEQVRLAARLADVAIQEMQYRFWIQKPVVKYTRPARRRPLRRGR
jgi:hypothetical protein